MGKIEWKFESNLEEKTIKKIHIEALRLIEETGILIPSENVLKLIPRDNGVYIREKNRVCIKPEKIEEILGPFPKNDFKDENEEIKFFVSGYSLRCYDLRTGQIKKPTTIDLIEFTKIAHQLGAYGNAMVMPGDLPEELSEIATYKLCLDVSDRIYGAGVYSSPEVFDIIQELLYVINKRYEIFMHMVSPLSFDKFLIENGVRYIGKGCDFSVGNMPMIGATAPVDYLKALVLSIAEVIGGAVILKIISPESNVSFSPFMYPFDMKYGSIVFGGPDFIKANIILVEIGKFYGIKIMGKVFNTMGKIPGDAQMGLSFCGAVLLLLMGVKNFGWGGMCCIDEIASIEQAIIQNEILKAAIHFVNGIEFDDELKMDVIKDCLKENSFLTHPETIEKFRKTFFISDIFSNETFNLWDKKGRKSLWEKARGKAFDLLKKHKFERDEYEKREIERIWKKAVEKFS
jgi:trimethylamine:corrinoid methyltransferase-like protein